MGRHSLSQPKGCACMSVGDGPPKLYLASTENGAVLFEADDMDDAEAICLQEGWELQ